MLVVEFLLVPYTNIPVLLWIFWINASMTKLSVCCSKSHRAARPVSAFQKCRNVSLFRCFLEINLYRFNVRSRRFLNVCSQLSFISASVAIEITLYRSRSVRFIRPADPKDNKTETSKVGAISKAQKAQSF